VPRQQVRSWFMALENVEGVKVEWTNDKGASLSREFDYS
jgi:hypothetical protein